MRIESVARKVLYSFQVWRSLTRLEERGTPISAILSEVRKIIYEGGGERTSLVSLEAKRVTDSPFVCRKCDLRDTRSCILHSPDWHLNLQVGSKHYSQLSEGKPVYVTCKGGLPISVTDLDAQEARHN